MSKWTLTVLVAGVAAFCVAQDLRAQGYGGMSSSSGGVFGSSGSPFSNAGSAFTSSSNAFGSSSGMGTGGLTGGGAFGSTMGGTTTGAMGMGMTGMGTAGASMYGMRAGNGQTALPGINQGMMGTQSSNRSTTTTTGANSRTQNSGRRRGSNNSQQQQQTTANRDLYRYQPRIEVGFDVPTPAPTVAVTNVAKSLRLSVPGSRFSGIQIVLDGGTAVLRGTVASPNDAELAAQLALLEPAIVSVRNELSIAPPPKAPRSSAVSAPAVPR